MDKGRIFFNNHVAESASDFSYVRVIGWVQEHLKLENYEISTRLNERNRGKPRLGFGHGVRLPLLNYLPSPHLADL